MSLNSLMADHIQSPVLGSGPESVTRYDGPHGSSPGNLRQPSQETQSSLQSPMSSPSPSPSRSPLIDRAGALSRMGDDLELLQEMAAMFIRDVPRLMTTLQEALEAGDAEETARAAHSIKGLASNFGGAPCMEAALVIEEPAKSGQLANLETRVGPLSQQVDLLCDALRREILA